MSVASGSTGGARSGRLEGSVTLPDLLRRAPRCDDWSGDKGCPTWGGSLSACSRLGRTPNRERKPAYRAAGGGQQTVADAPREPADRGAGACNSARGSARKGRVPLGLKQRPAVVKSQPGPLTI